MPLFSICTAYKDLGDPARRAAFEWTSRYWATVFPQAEHVVAAPEPFTRARGLNAAVQAAQCDLIVQADPDSVVEAYQLTEALMMAQDADGLVVPFDRYLYLTAEATARLQEGPSPIADRQGRYLPAMGPDDAEEHGSGSAGPVTVYRRTTWEEVGGYDERFPLWGGDDSVFAYCTDAYFGPLRRVPGDLLHCWHPRLPASVPGGPGYAAQFDLLAQYRDAAAVGPEAVRALLESHRVR